MDLGNQMPRGQDGISAEVGVSPVSSLSQHSNDNPVGGRQAFLFMNPDFPDKAIREKVSSKYSVYPGVLQHPLFHHDTAPPASFLSRLEYPFDISLHPFPDRGKESAHAQ